jgi:hypothetical protein
MTAVERPSDAGVPTMIVLVVGGSPQKMALALAVLESNGYDAIGVHSEEAAQREIAVHDELFAVVAGGVIEKPARDRLRSAAARKGAALVTAQIGHDDPAVHFTNRVLPKLMAVRHAAIR